MVFTWRMVPEVVQPFWAALQRGEFITGAAEGVGSYREMGGRWLAAAGGVRPRRGRDLTGRYLSFAERDEIAVARAAGESVRWIARRLGRSPSTVSRELRRHAQPDGGYRATSAHARAWERASRPKPAKLVVNARLRELVQADLERKYSPEQIAGRLRIQVSRRAGDVGVCREDLPVSVRDLQRRFAPRADEVLADGQGAA